MRTVAIFKNGKNQAIRLPKEFQFEGANQLEILRQGDTVILRPARPTWGSFLNEPLTDIHFLAERPSVIEEGRFLL